ncbi:MAG: hypothetical protein IT372_17935, partial [Polyangiaceae bacterium]|nr:hypothetical protein [Polyangiaceae bacterium]
ALERAQDLLALLSYTGDDPDLRARKRRVEDQIAEWEHHPFQPHRIARLRPAAYQKAIVMKYIDNLLAWGDQLFRRDTIESINEATQLYLLAKGILGPRPARVPTHRSAGPSNPSGGSGTHWPGQLSPGQVEVRAQSSSNQLSPVQAPASSAAAIATVPMRQTEDAPPTRRSRSE